jgi:hypothetical protein
MAGEDISFAGLGDMSGTDTLDPFGGGTEGLPQIPTAGQGFDLPDFSGAAGRTQGGLMDFAKGLFGRGEDPGAPRQPGAPGGGLDTLSGFAKGVVMPAAQLGLSGLGIKSSLDAAGNARRQAGALAQGQQIQRESAQPLQQFGSRQLSQASAGKIDPAVQQEIDNLVQAQIMQARQWMATNKITDSTMMQSIERDIMNRAEAMKAQVIGMDKNTAIQALQAAMQGGGQISQTASQEQNQLDSLILQSNRALAALTGSAG